MNSRRILIFLLSLPLHAQFIQQGPKLLGSNVMGTAGMGWYDAISADGNTAVIGGLGDSNNTGAAWVFTRVNGAWQQQAKLVGTPTTGQSFQGTVGISGDGNTIVLGGYNDANRTGAVWVFTRSNGVWSQMTKILPTSVLGTIADFGDSVAISGDGKTIAVGGASDNYPAGAVWIYTLNNGVWTQQGGKIFGTGATGNFGWSVALSNDGSTLAVGEINNDEQGDGTATGGVWFFARTNGTWAGQGGRMIGSGAATRARQGYSVSLSADGNTAIEGGRDDNNTVGAAWIYRRSGVNWTQWGSKLVASDYSGKSFQGSSVSMSGDGNTAVIGGWGDNNSTGAFWVFKQIDGTWTQQGSKIIGTGAVGEYEAYSVAISSDAHTIFVGANDAGGGPGAAWAFTSPVTPAQPSAASSPTSGSGMTQTFTFNFTDTAGAQAFAVLNILIRDVLDGRQACYIAFAPATSSVFLVDNAGDAGGPFSGMVLPSSNSIGNSQCTISGTGSSVAKAGNALTLTLAITFMPSFTGNKVIYMAATDPSFATGWQAAGTWNIPGSGVLGPSVTGMAPGRGSGFTQTLTFTFNDTNGFLDISVANVLIASAIDGRHACYLALTGITASSALAQLVDDAGDAGGPFSNVLLPSAGTAFNSQCTISGTGSAVTGSGNTVTVTLPITFAQNFLGNLIVYAAARNNNGQNSGWQAVGSVIVK
jgi:hypothetical protein